jgi:lysophospholipase L1-like esterase
MHSPLRVANEILDRIAAIVADIEAINPRARILILGGYNPVPNHEHATLINYYLTVWDRVLTHRFDDDQRVYIVHINDLVGPEQLSRIDNFHPSGEAYEQISKRIATVLLT